MVKTFLVEQLSLLLLDEIQEREARHIVEILAEWDALEGKVPLFADYVKVRLVQKWLEFAILN